MALIARALSRTAAAAKRTVATRVARAGRRLTKSRVACRLPRRHGHWTFAERVARPGGLQGGRRVRVLLPVQSAIVVQPHHKALLVLLQMRQQLVVIAFAIHYMDRARLRSQVVRTVVTPSAQRRLSFCGSLNRARQCGFASRLRSGCRTNGASRSTPSGARSPSAETARSVCSQNPWRRGPSPPSRRAAFPRGTRFRWCHAAPARPLSPFSGRRSPAHGARHRVERDRRFRRYRYSASVSASLAHASGNPVSGCCSSAAMTRSQRALSRASPDPHRPSPPAARHGRRSPPAT